MHRKYGMYDFTALQMQLKYDLNNLYVAYIIQSSCLNYL